MESTQNSNSFNESNNDDTKIMMAYICTMIESGIINPKVLLSYMYEIEKLDGLRAEHYKDWSHYWDTHLKPHLPLKKSFMDCAFYAERAFKVKAEPDERNFEALKFLSKAAPEHREALWKAGCDAAGSEYPPVRILKQFMTKNEWEKKPNKYREADERLSEITQYCDPNRISHIVEMLEKDLANIEQDNTGTLELSKKDKIYIVNQLTHKFCSN